MLLIIFSICNFKYNTPSGNELFLLKSSLLFMNVKSILFCFLLFSLCVQLRAERFPDQGGRFSDIPLKERIYLGGNLGLQFGNPFTFVEVSPLIGLWLQPQILVGGGPVYRYFRRSDINFEDNQFGGRLFSRYHFAENFFAHAEYELLNLTDYRFPPDNPRTNINSVLIGGGYVQNLGGSSLFIMALVNLTETELTPYSNPVIRVGFNIGL